MDILVVDDEVEIRDLLALLLREEGHAVDQAANGREALAALERKNYDFAFIDVMMPPPTGMEILHHLSGREDAPLAVILTGHGTLDDAVQAVHDGAFEFILKPFDMGGIRNALHQGERLLKLRRENHDYRARLEDMVREKTSELHQRNEELALTCEKLSIAIDMARRNSRLAALGELASGVAHEIRNPLSAINLAAGNLSAQYPEEDAVQDCVNDITTTVGTLRRTLEKILNFARPTPPHLESGCIYDAIDSAMSLTGRMLQKAGVAVDIDLGKSPPRVIFDEAHTQQIMVNLLLNASRAMPTGGTVRIRGNRQPGQFHTKVIDEGQGIDSDLKEQIFTPFFSHFEDGTGLGLSISRNLAESQNGKLWVEDSEGGAGATFVLALPIANKEGGDDVQ